MLRKLVPLFLILLLAACSKEEEPANSNYFVYQGQTYPIGEAQVYYDGLINFEDSLFHAYSIVLYSADIKPVYDAQGNFYRARGSGPIFSMELYCPDSIQPSNALYKSWWNKEWEEDRSSYVFRGCRAIWQHNQYGGDWLFWADYGAVDFNLSKSGALSITGDQIENYDYVSELDSTFWYPVELQYSGEIIRIIDRTFP